MSWKDETEEPRYLAARFSPNDSLSDLIEGLHRLEGELHEKWPELDLNAYTFFSGHKEILEGVADGTYTETDNYIVIFKKKVEN